MIPRGSQLHRNIPTRTVHDYVSCFHLDYYTHVYSLHPPPPPLTLHHMMHHNPNIPSHVALPTTTQFQEIPIRNTVLCYGQSSFRFRCSYMEGDGGGCR